MDISDCIAALSFHTQVPDALFAYVKIEPIDYQGRSDG